MGSPGLLRLKSSVTLDFSRAATCRHDVATLALLDPQFSLRCPGLCGHTEGNVVKSSLSPSETALLCSVVLSNTGSASGPGSPDVPSPAGSKIEKTQLSEDWNLWALKQSYCIHTLNRGCFSRVLAELISLSGPLLVCMYVCACIFMYVCTYRGYICMYVCRHVEVRGQHQLPFLRCRDILRHCLSLALSSPGRMG